jgi:hypothetical protein
MNLCRRENRNEFKRKSNYIGAITSFLFGERIGNEDFPLRGILNRIK